MEKLSVSKAFSKSKEYSSMLPKDRVQLRKRRLYELVTYAKANSPLYASVYENLKDNFTLRDIPTITRDDIVSDYDNWATDRAVHLDDLYRYTERNSDSDRQSMYLNKYHVVSSSGTDHEPMLSLYDANEARMLSVQHALRSFARREHIWQFVFRGMKLASIYSTGGVFFPNAFTQMRSKYLPLRRGKSLLLEAQSSTSSLVSALNKFNPSVLSGYPSALLRMADEQTAGRLKIKPVCIMASDEPLTEEARLRISSAFGCDVFSSYVTSLTGCIAYECREHHMHVNDDWVIVEPVNRANDPVGSGRESDHILVTNLLSYTQPVIRYEIGDRVIMHESECLCGNPSPWLEIAGKSMDQIRFVDGTREVIVPVAELDAVLKNEKYLKRYQILIYPNNHLALRLTGTRGTDKTMAFFKAEKCLRAYMKSIGIVAPMITLEKEDPQPHPLSGKYQTIITN